MTLTRMSTKDRDNEAELKLSLKQAKDAKAELDFAKKIAEAAQLDAAAKVEQARLLSRERSTWEAERGKWKAERDEALAVAKEQQERSEASEAALKSIAGTASPPATAIAQARKQRGINDHPNAENVQKQQTRAKIEKARLAMEEEKRARAKAERELQRALEEQQRLQAKLEKATSVTAAEGGDAGPEAAAASVVHRRAAASTAKPASAGGSIGSRAGNKTSGASRGKGASDTGKHMSTGIEELTLARELGEMEADLHSARELAGSASTRIADEEQRRVRAEGALERFTRITALQRAATDALQVGMASPGREAPGDETGAADEALQRLAAEIRASGLASAITSASPSRNETPRSPLSATPRSQSVATPRSQLGTPQGSFLFNRDPPATPEIEGETVGGVPGE
jgi:hypothetical protein